MVEREKLTEKIQKIYKIYGHILLEAATGSGKSLQAIKLIKKERWLIVVPKLVLIDNWKDEFIKHGYKSLLELVEFVTYASLEKYAATTRKRSIILDEVHNMNERRYLAIKDILNIDPFTKKGTGRGHVIALSGSVDNDRRPMLHRLGISTQSTFKYTTDEAVDDKIISDYKILVVSLFLENKTPQPLRFNKWKTTYNLTEEDAYANLERNYKDLLRKGLDTKFAVLDRMKFLYDLPTKFNAARLILSQLSESRRILTFGSSIDQVDKLCPHTHHSKKSKKDTTLQDFKDGKLSRLGAIQTIAEGVNIPDLDTGFVVQAMSKSRHMIQRLGRMLRTDDNENKKATLIVLAIQGTQDEKWVSNSLSYFDSDKIYYTDIKTIKNHGIENILSNLGAKSTLTY